MIINSLILSYLFLLIIQPILSNIIVYNDSNTIFIEIKAQEGELDPSIPSDGLRGYVTTTNPLNGCERIAPPPNIPTFEYKWIALIPRTPELEKCEFATKIQNAYNANFSAVIVYNSDDSGLITMGPSDAKVGIPATFVSHTDGLLLMQNYLYNITSVNSTPQYHIKITPSPPFNIIGYIIVSALVIGVSFLILIGFMFVKFYLQRNRTHHHRLPRSALKQLKTKKFAKDDPWEVCAICLDDYEEGAKLRILPCEHAYHMKCIDPWLLNNRRQCPVCKRYVFPNLDNSDEEENSGHQQTRTPTEQTPLINPNDTNSGTDISINRQLSERQFLNPLGSGAPNVLFAANESSDDDKDLSLSSGPTTTAEFIFERSSLNSRRYGSTHDSSTTTRATTVFVDSLGGTTDDTNVFAHSRVEDVSDIETTDDDNDDDERMHAVVNGSEENPAYVNDEHSTHTNQTSL